MDTKYSDIRSEFFRDFFNQGLNYEHYVASGEAGQIANVRNFQALCSLTAEQEKLLATFTRQMKVLVLSGLWCGDCTRQLPMLAAIEASCPLIQMRYFDSRSNLKLHNELRINGAYKVPVVLVLSEDFYELARFGDRHLSVYRRMAAAQLGISCDTGLIPPPVEQLKLEIAEWVSFFERLQLMLRLAPLLRGRYGD